MSSQQVPFKALSIAVLTVSDTRTTETDTSGKFLADALQEAGHSLFAHEIVIDDVYKLRAKVSNWIASEAVQAILITGGTGFTQRDVTPQALTPLFDRPVDGFGELFRHISYTEIGSSTVQSRAFAGMANATVIFCLPGSTGACKTGWNSIIKEQLDASHRPCNFVPHLKTGVDLCDSRDS